jgi:hypothetical protein
MAPSKRARFTHTDLDLDKERQSIQALVEEYKLCSIEDEDLTGDATKQCQFSVMEEWKTLVQNNSLISTDAKNFRYFGLIVKEDPDQIWVDLCKSGKVCTKAFAWVQAFLTKYISSSVAEFPIFGPEEYEKQPAVTCASSLENVWRLLVAETDSTVLKQKRREDPDGEAKWRLRYLATKENAFTKGPVAEISKVSLGCYALM